MAYKCLTGAWRGILFMICPVWPCVRLRMPLVKPTSGSCPLFLLSTCFIVVVVVCFETGCYYVALAILKLTQIYLSLPFYYGIKGLAHHIWLFFFLRFMCIIILPTSACVHHVCALCLRRSEGSVRSPGTGVRNDCEPPCGFSKPRTPAGTASALNC